MCVGNLFLFAHKLLSIRFLGKLNSLMFLRQVDRLSLWFRLILAYSSSWNMPMQIHCHVLRQQARRIPAFSLLCVRYGCIIWLALRFGFSLRGFLVLGRVRKVLPSAKRSIYPPPREMSMEFLSHDDNWARGPME